jgi:hypothetical protein
MRGAWLNLPKQVSSLSVATIKTTDEVQLTAKRQARTQNVLPALFNTKLQHDTILNNGTTNEKGWKWSLLVCELRSHGRECISEHHERIFCKKVSPRSENTSVSPQGLGVCLIVKVTYPL